MTLQTDNLIGRSPEDLSIDERLSVAGQWAALEIYSPATLPQRRMQAIGASVADCMRQLRQKGLDPGNFEFVVMTRSF